MQQNWLQEQLLAQEDWTLAYNLRYYLGNWLISNGRTTCCWWKRTWSDLKCAFQWLSRKKIGRPSLNKTLMTWHNWLWLEIFRHILSLKNKSLTLISTRYLLQAWKGYAVNCYFFEIVYLNYSSRLLINTGDILLEVHVSLVIVPLVIGV